MVIFSDYTMWLHDSRLFYNVWLAVCVFNIILRGGESTRVIGGGGRGSNASVIPCGTVYLLLNSACRWGDARAFPVHHV